MSARDKRDKREYKSAQTLETKAPTMLSELERENIFIRKNVLEWLKRCAYDQHGLASKPTPAILLCS